MVQLPEISNIQEFVLSNPLLVGVLVVIIYVGVAWQRSLGYRQYRMFHLLKTGAFRVLDGRFTKLGRPLIHPKHRPEDSREYLTTIDAPPRVVFQRFREAGASPHLIASTKSRPGPDGGTQYTHSQLVYIWGDGTQTEYYLFTDGDGKADVYGHNETAVLDPEGHVSDGITPAKHLPDGYEEPTE